MGDLAVSTPRSRATFAWARRALVCAAVVVGAPTVLIALAHVGPLRPALGPLVGKLFGTPASCPVSITGLTREEIDRHRVEASRSLAGDVPARARVAGPFTLGMARSEVDVWTKRAGIACREEQSGTALRCERVSSEALGTSPSAPHADDVFLRFDVHEKLVGVDVMRVPAAGAIAEALARELAAKLEREVGAPRATHGELAAAYFDAPGMKMTIVEFRFTDFAADVSVSRMEEQGELMVREQYRSVER